MGQLKLNLVLCSEKGKEEGGVVHDGGRARAKVRSERLDKPDFWSECLAFVSVCTAQIRHCFFICSLMSTCTNSTFLLLKK